MVAQKVSRYRIVVKPVNEITFSSRGKVSVERCNEVGIKYSVLVTKITVRNAAICVVM